MQIPENISLKNFNTFGIDAKAKQFAAFSSPDELDEILKYNQRSKKPLFILGGGSNILFTKDYDGLILKNELKGIEIIDENDDYYFVKAAAGENWHQFVKYCLNNNFGGLENLSLIPGCVGASPMQNIGAYGVEIKDVFEKLDAYNIKEHCITEFNLNDCKFGYRESVFKTKYKNEFVILSVTFRLRKHPVFNISYDALKKELEKMNVQELSIKKISEAVISIRQSKLPDPNEIGNAGSFFKNPEIKKEKFELLQKKFPEIVGYKLSDIKIKLAAAWLIEHCGWKGYRKNDAGCHAKQALVLVNYGNASGAEILELSEKIIESVKNKFDVVLEKEVNVV